MSYVKDEDIFNATNGGLEIILYYYPNANKVFHKAQKSFKIRESEKTASASLKQLPSGIWLVTDFGGDQVSRNAIQICSLEEGIDYGKACSILGERYHIEGAKSEVFIPIISKRDLKSTEKPKDYFFEFHKEISEKHLKLLGPRVSQGNCKEINLKSCISFDYCKTNEVIVTTATVDYPIFVFDFGDWQKIYQPLSFEKQFRFRYAGTKPSRIMWGMETIKKEFAKKKKKAEEEDYDFSINDESEGNVKAKKNKFDPRLDRVFIASGGSDGLNLRSFNHYAVWFNSESEHINYEEYKDLKSMAKEIIYLADLDHTGKKQALETGLKYLDIKLLWLPEKLKEFKDRRGNPCKDFKDFVEKFYRETDNYFSHTLTKLISNALPLQFWTEYTNANTGKVQYNLSNTKLYHFLNMLGFGRYESEAEKDGYIFVRKEGSVVRILQSYQIENFVHDFLEERGMNTDLRDYIYKNSQISEKSLSKLNSIKIDFNSADRNTQFLFFNKKIWRITADEILEFKQGEVDKYVWEDKIIDFDIKKEEAHFTVIKDEAGELDIEVSENEGWFFNYLKNASRVHWKEELESSFEGKKESLMTDYADKYKFDIAGPNLDENKIHEQKLHLINKMYSIGYLCHKYKNQAKPWAVFAMDNKISDLGESHGGSGKSVCYGPGLLPILKRRVYLKGRDQKLTQNDFIYSEVSQDTDYILVDDATQYLNFDFFFSEITGSLKVNAKMISPFEVPFEKSPKFVFTSNFALRNIDPSTARRLLFTVFSDYYHGTSDDEYKQVRKVSDDFGGKNLFTDFDWKQWNHYYNFIAQCIQLFLKIEDKINPPMDNVTKRSLQAEMGDVFEGWADGFFSEMISADNGLSIYKNIDNEFAKDDAYEFFLKATKQSKWSSAKFKKAISAYCKLKLWIMNPKHMHNSGNRIIKTINGKSTEIIYIDTQNAEKLNNVEKLFEDEDDKTAFDLD